MRGPERWIAPAALGAVLVAAGGVIASGDDDARSCPARTFDRRTWMADDSMALGGLLDHGTKRRKLADDLVACRRLVGLRRAEVRRLLGRPMDAEGDRMHYELGSPSAVTLDSDVLALRFDRRGRVAEAEILPA